MSEEKKYPENVRLARLYEKQSKTGQMYLSGRLGDTRIAILKSKDVADDGTAMWDILLSKAPPRVQTQTANNKYPDGGPAPRTQQTNRVVDDEIPF